MSGMYLEGVWNVSGRCLEGNWSLTLLLCGLVLYILFQLNYLYTRFTSFQNLSYHAYNPLKSFQWMGCDAQLWSEPCLWIWKWTMLNNTLFSGILFNSLSSKMCFDVVAGLMVWLAICQWHRENNIYKQNKNKIQNSKEIHETKSGLN